MSKKSKNLSVLAAVLCVAGLLLFIPEDANAQARRVKDDRARVVRVLPKGHVTIEVGSRSYHYLNGVFYHPARSGYVVVRAPRGAVVRTLPRTYVTLRIGARVYYRVGTTYYVRIDDGYQVVEPPLGGAVDMLPVGYETVYVDDEAFYLHEEVWYRYDPGRDVYVVVEEP